MSRFLNSLQNQLFAIGLLLAILVVASVSLNVRLIRTVETNLRQADAASFQRSNSYLLASLARRLVNAEAERDIAGIEGLIASTVENIRQVQQALRIGNEELDIQPIQGSEGVSSLLNDLDGEWDELLLLVEQIDTVSGDEQAALLTRIDLQSVTVFTFADRLVKGLDITIQQQQRQVQQFSFAIVVMAIVTLVIAIIVVSRIVRSVQQLTATARKLASGDLSARASVSGLSETAQVGAAFNTMASRLDNLVGELEKQVDEAEKARQIAERSDQVKSAFLASMSHELRTPLNSVINFTKFVVRGIMGPITERQEETLNKVIASGQHLLGLINDVLDMSKIESGSLNLFIEDDININEVLDNVLASGEAIISDKPIALKKDIQPDLPLMRGDRKRMTQIFLNVVSNACKYTKEGYVKVTAKEDEGILRFTVEDTGPGIATDDQEAVFESFKQTNSGLRQGEGTGLGMPISRSLTEAHGGRLWFESTVGEGTTFHVTLPIKSEKLQPVT